MIVVGILLLLAAACAAILLKKYTAFFAYHLYKHQVIIMRDLAYIDGSANPKHKLDVYLPKQSGKFPIIHFIYGGYWTSGDKCYKQWLTGLYGNIGTSLAGRGIGVVVSNYRVGPESAIESQLVDVAAAIKWTATHSKQWNSNGKLYVMGHSAGAHIISLLAANPMYYKQHGIGQNVIKGYLALSPILDVPSMVKSHDPDFNRRISFPVFGNTPRHWHRYSPVDHFLSKPNKALRLSIIIGGNDFEHIRVSALSAHKKMTKAGIPATLTDIPGYNHTALVTRFGQRNDPIINLVIDFVKP